jgi:hypothetical protein
VTYEANGTQYIAVPIGGASQRARIVGMRVGGTTTG